MQQRAVLLLRTVPAAVAAGVTHGGPTPLQRRDRPRQEAAGAAHMGSDVRRTPLLAGSRTAPVARMEEPPSADPRSAWTNSTASSDRRSFQQITTYLGPDIYI